MASIRVNAEEDLASAPMLQGSERAMPTIARDCRGAKEVIHLAAEELADLLTGASLPKSLANFFRAPCSVPLRQRLEGSDGRELLVMPVHSDEYAGIKTLTIIPDNAGTERSVISGLFTLFDFRTGAALATIDASELTGRRTAAVSALAACRLARRNASHLTILGAGHLPPYLAAAYAEVRPLERVTLWARNAARATAVAGRIRESLGSIDVQVCSDLRTAVQSGDVVVAATRSTEPLIRGDWLRPGVHVDLIGGYRPDMREIDDAGIVSGRIYVDDREAALEEAGDLVDPLKRGVIQPTAILGDLSDLVSRPRVERAEADITIFKSVGTARADLGTAIAAWERRVTRGAKELSQPPSEAAKHI